MSADIEGNLPPPPWISHAREDGSVIMSLGDPRRGRHQQFDFYGSEDVARLMCASRELRDALTLARDLGINYQTAEQADQIRAAIAKAAGQDAEK
ncbi:MAG: hypothetical protein HQL97_01005 [Magnetococcales bacterium]|nr:hypothetical protein [Magnetococcales bacterium]